MSCDPKIHIFFFQNDFLLAMQLHREMNGPDADLALTIQHQHDQDMGEIGASTSAQAQRLPVPKLAVNNASKAPLPPQVWNPKPQPFSPKVTLPTQRLPAPQLVVNKAQKAPMPQQVWNPKPQSSPRVILPTQRPLGQLTATNDQKARVLELVGNPKPQPASPRVIQPQTLPGPKSAVAQTSVGNAYKAPMMLSNVPSKSNYKPYHQIQPKVPQPQTFAAPQGTAPFQMQSTSTNKAAAPSIGLPILAGSSLALSTPFGSVSDHFYAPATQAKYKPAVAPPTAMPAAAVLSGQLRSPAESASTSNGASSSKAPHNPATCTNVVPKIPNAPAAPIQQKKYPWQIQRLATLPTSASLPSTSGSCLAPPDNDLHRIANSSRLIKKEKSQSNHLKLAAQQHLNHTATSKTAANVQQQQVIAVDVKRTSPSDFHMPALNCFIKESLADWTVVSVEPFVEKLSHDLRYHYLPHSSKPYDITWDATAFTDSTNFIIDIADRSVALNPKTLLNCSRGNLISVLLHIMIHFVVYDSSKARGRLITDHDTNFM